MADTPTFVFGDDGKAYAYLGGKIVAAAADVDELEKKLAAGGIHPAHDPYAEPGAGLNDPFGPGTSMHDDAQGYQGEVCPDCQGTGSAPDYDVLAEQGGPVGPGACPTCGGTGQNPGDAAAPGLEVDPLPAASPDTIPGDELPPRATHITTPNGLKGQILGKVKGLWGDQVTIRLENGRIAKFDVTDTSKVAFVDEDAKKTASTSPYAALEARLAAMPDGTKESLTDRIKELKQIKKDAATLIRSANYVDEQTIHNLVVQADYELREVTDALAALEDAEPYAPPAPFDTGVAEQEAMGGHDSTWLDEAVQEMIAENEATDFDQMMDEAPEMLVADLETPVLEDAGAVRDQAAALVTSKTAGLNKEASTEFRTAFLARVEDCRRAELGRRATEPEGQTKEASNENHDGPAEGLFM